MFTFFKMLHKEDVTKSKTMKSLALSMLFFCLFLTEDFNKESKETTTYTFNQKIVLTASSAEDDNVEVDYFFDSNDSSIVCMRMNADMEMGSNESVYFLFKNDKIELLINAAGMKMKKTMTKEEFSAMNGFDEISEQTDLSKTGNTKSILGYECEEYKITTNDGEVMAWVCKDFPIAKSFIPMLGMHAKSPFDGFVMELQTTASKEKAVLKITEVDLKANLVLDTSSYKDFKF